MIRNMKKRFKEGYYYNSEGEECDPEDIGYQRIDYSDNDEDIGYSEDHNYKLSYNKYDDIYWIERYNPEYDSWTKIDYTKPEDNYLDTLLDKYNIVSVLKESVEKRGKNTRKLKEFEETFYGVFEDGDIDSLFNGNTDFKVTGRDLQLVSDADQFATFKEDGFAGYEFVLTTRDGSKQYEVEVQFYRDDSCTDNVIIRDSNSEIIGEFALKRDCPAWAARNKIVAWLNGNKHYIESKMTINEKRAFRKGYLKGLKEAKDVRATAVNEIADALEDYGYEHLTVKDYDPYYVYLPFEEPSHGLGSDYRYFKKTVNEIADKYNLYCEIEVDKSRNDCNIGVSARLY